MKKIYFLLIIVVSIIFIFGLYRFIIWKFRVETIANMPENDEKFSITAQYDLETNQVKAAIKNEGNDIVSFDLNYEIEIKQNHKWKSFYKELNIDSIAIELAPQETYLQEIPLFEEMNIKKNEVYRISKNIDDIYYRSNEFVVG